MCTGFVNNKKWSGLNRFRVLYSEGIGRAGGISDIDKVMSVNYNKTNDT